jgi:hypothetical protein
MPKVFTPGSGCEDVEHLIDVVVLGNAQRFNPSAQILGRVEDKGISLLDLLKQTQGFEVE